MLPISFGSLGIREGAYIVVYGLFGLPAETMIPEERRVLLYPLYLLGFMMIYSIPDQNM
jgi:uncharacterized membrane protein YbhN (UPF0104 family)